MHAALVTNSRFLRSSFCSNFCRLFKFYLSIIFKILPSLIKKISVLAFLNIVLIKRLMRVSTKMIDVLLGEREDGQVTLLRTAETLIHVKML